MGFWHYKMDDATGVALPKVGSSFDPSKIFSVVRHDNDVTLIPISGIVSYKNLEDDLSGIVDAAVKVAAYSGNKGLNFSLGYNENIVPVTGKRRDEISKGLAAGEYQVEGFISNNASHALSQGGAEAQRIKDIIAQGRGGRPGFGPKPN